MPVQVPKAKQRFLSLDVDEVSLVDQPANTEKFIVMKSHTPEAKLDEKTEERAAQAAEASAEAQILIQTVAVLKDLKDGKANSTTGDTQYDMPSMVKKLQSLCSNKSMPPDLKAKLEKFIAKAFPTKDDPSQPGSKPTAVKAKGGKKAADAGDTDEEEVTSAAKGGKKGKAPGAGKDPAVDTANPAIAKNGVQKAVGDGVGDPQVELIHSLLSASMSTLQKVSMLVDMEVAELDASPVEKGLKQFSAERVDALKQAAKQMVDLLKELNPAHLKDLGMFVADSAADMEDKPSTGTLSGGADGGVDGAGDDPPKAVLAPGAAKDKNPPNLPDGPAQGDSSPLDASAVANTIKKAVEEALGPIMKQMDSVQKSNTELQTKITELEAVRGVSKSLVEEPTDGKPVQKRESLFKGVV